VRHKRRKSNTKMPARWIEKFNKNPGRVGAACAGKMKHGSKRKAEAFALAWARKHNEDVKQSYKCETCGGWHCGGCLGTLAAVERGRDKDNGKQQQ